MKYTEIDKNNTVDCFGLVRTVEKKVAKNGSMYLDLTLCDKDGEVMAKYWDLKEEDFVPETDLVLKIRGKLQQYNGADQLAIQKMRLAEESEFDLADFIKIAEYPGETMFSEIIDIVNGFADEEIKDVVLAMLIERKTQLLTLPAAEKLHHAMVGGLLYHTLSIVRLAECVCSIYPCIDRELLLSGAILHDFAKVREYDISPIGLVANYSIEGILLGHLVMGAEEVAKKCDELGINPEKKFLLQHMVLSHHGKPEFGAAVKPAFIEAEILSQLDAFDANMYEMAEAINEAEVGKFTNKIWALDNRKFFNHGRKDVKPQAKII